MRAIVAIHRVRNGRAVGGCRARDFASDDEALTDVLRLSRGMTYKTALAGLPYGGAKAVILGRPTPEGLRAFGRAVDSLGGTYVTAEDVGIGRADLAVMKEETPWVLGADDVGGVAAPFTALGVFHAMRGALRHVGTDLPGLTVAVQGTGAVGSRLCALLRDAGARLVVADVDAASAAAVPGAEVVDPDVDPRGRRRRARALRAGRHAQRAHDPRDPRPDRRRRGQQPARHPGGRRAAGGPRHHVRPRLPRERGRRHERRERARRLRPRRRRGPHRADRGDGGGGARRGRSDGGSRPARPRSRSRWRSRRDERRLPARHGRLRPRRARTRAGRAARASRSRSP